MWEIYNKYLIINTLAKFHLDVIVTLTVSKDRICLFVWKKEKLFRASLSHASCNMQTITIIIISATYQYIL